MLINKAGEIPSSEITSQSVYLNRRKFLAGAAVAGVAAAAGLRDLILPTVAEAGNRIDGIRKSSFSTNEKLTEYKDVTTYNNYYEFSSDKDGPAALAKNFRTRP
jgi:methionine sulfoxide reductase catalytic subunit